MILTQIQLDQIKQEVRYDGELGQFFYLKDRLLPFKPRNLDPDKQRVVTPPPKVAHRAGDRADKVYGGQFIGVYVLGKVLNAAHLALYFITGDWPEAVQFRDQNWRHLQQNNLAPITKSEQARLAATARYQEHERDLPPNVYGTSSGKFIGRVGDRRTAQFKTVKQVLMAIDMKRWVN